MVSKRPKLVWAIAILCILAGMSQLLSHTAIISELIPIDERAQAVVASWSLLDKIATYVLSTLLLSAAIALFMMKRIAFHLFVGYLVLVTLATVQQAITSDVIAQFGNAAWSAVAGLLLFSVVVWYVSRLRASVEARVVSSNNRLLFAPYGRRTAATLRSASSAEAGRYASRRGPTHFRRTYV